MREDSHATRQQHYQLRCGPFNAKDLASVASLRPRYASVTDKLAATRHHKIL